MNKEIRYNQAIKTLQENDHNATYDEILQDYNNNIAEAYECLKSTLEQLIEEFSIEDITSDEYKFYKNVLQNLENEVLN